MFIGSVIKRGGSLLLIIIVIGAVIMASGWPGRTTAAQQSGTSNTYTVKQGDTLFRIALYYGVTVDAIVAANHLADPSHIEVGQVLIIPSGVPANANPAAPVYAIPYTVQPGDTLRSIALRYGITPEALAAANGITDPNMITVGQTLTVPSSQPPATLSPTVTAIPTLTPTATLKVPPPIVLSPTNTMSPTITPTAAPITPETGTSTATPSVPATLSSIITATLAPTNVPPTATPVLRTYTVAPGDELSQIAEAYGVNVDDLIALNQIADPNLIYAGMLLKIPNSSVNPSFLAVDQDTPSLSSPITRIGIDTTGKQIIVILHEQRVYIYNNGELVRHVRVSTGLPGTPTVTGHYHIYEKYTAQLMVGPGYYLPAVPWVMYFYEGYGLHGTYWHHNWGHPMSHGCVNMPTDQAAWLYNWAPTGTSVWVFA